MGGGRLLSGDPSLDSNAVKAVQLGDLFYEMHEMLVVDVTEVTTDLVRGVNDPSEGVIECIRYSANHNLPIDQLCTMAGKRIQMAVCTIRQMHLTRDSFPHFVP